MISGCAINDVQSTPFPRPRLQITPIILTLTFEGTCNDDPASLEYWVGSALAARENLSMLLAELRSQSPDNMDDGIVERLVTMRNGMAMLAAPDCAVQAHTLMITIIDSLLSLSQAYRNGDIPDVESEAGEIAERLGQFEQMVAVLLDRLEEIFETRIDQAGQ